MYEEPPLSNRKVQQEVPNLVDVSGEGRNGVSLRSTKPVSDEFVCQIVYVD